MDVIPIALLVLGASSWFWKRLQDASTGAFRLCAVAVLFGLVILYPSLNTATVQGKVTLAYFSFALILLAPAFTLSRIERTMSARLLLAATSMFSVAAVFRLFDWLPEAKLYFPSGTHYLWHIFGALSAHALIAAVFHFREPR